MQEKWYDAGKGEREIDLWANQLGKVGISGSRDLNNSLRRPENA